MAVVMAKIKSAVISKAIPDARARPIRLVRWAVILGIIAALVYAIAATSFQFRIDREATPGAFSGGFSAGFDIRRCSLEIEHIPTGKKLKFPLPVPACDMLLPIPAEIH